MNELVLDIRANKKYEFLREYGLYRHEVVYGGAGSGKSYAVAQHLILSTIEYTGRKYLCVRKVARTLRFSVFALLIEVINSMGAQRMFKINRSEMTITNIWADAEIICLGLDDPEKIKSIHGITDIWIEEASEITYEDFKQLNLRVRGGRLKKKIVLTFNPISSLLWIKEYFFDNPKRNARITHTTYQDNKYLDDEYREELERLAEIDRYFYEVYTLGLWGVLGNHVFTNFVIEEFDTNDELYESLCFGIDYGFNHASVLIKCGFRDGELYVLDEFYAKRLTNAELIQEGERFDPEYRDHIYTADSAEPDRIKEFNDKGWIVEAAKKGKGSVKYGIDFLKSKKIHVHATMAPNTAREIKLYHYRETRDGVVLDEPVEKEDDTIAAMRYAVERLWRDSGDWRPI